MGAEHRKHHKHGYRRRPLRHQQRIFLPHGVVNVQIKTRTPLDNVGDLLKMLVSGNTNGSSLSPSWLFWSARINWLHAITAINSARRFLGGLIPGVARVVMVQHATFCINSSAYDWQASYPPATVLEIAGCCNFTMGEGYHNYHHEFQWDYRNG